MDFKNVSNKKLKIFSIACGSSFTLILTNNGVYVSGQIGSNVDDIKMKNFSLMKFPNNEIIVQIACSDNHQLFLSEFGDVYSRGSNRYGQLCLGNNLNDKKDYIVHKINFKFESKVTQIKCGGYCTFILCEDGSVYSCGENYSGTLGLNCLEDALNLQEIKPRYFHYKKIKDIIINKGKHVFFQTENDHEYYFCGSNHKNQFGFIFLVKDYSTLLQQLSFNRGNEIVIPQKFKWKMGKIISISVGEDHTLILNDKNIVYSCGSNEEGQLGVGNSSDFNEITCLRDERIVRIKADERRSFFWNDKNEIFGCGINFNNFIVRSKYDYITPVKIPLQYVKDVFCCYSYCCFLTIDDLLIFSGTKAYIPCGFDKVGKDENYLSHPLFVNYEKHIENLAEIKETKRILQDIKASKKKKDIEQLKTRKIIVLLKKKEFFRSIERGFTVKIDKNWDIVKKVEIVLHELEEFEKMYLNFQNEFEKIKMEILKYDELRRVLLIHRMLKLLKIRESILIETSEYAFFQYELKKNDIDIIFKLLNKSIIGKNLKSQIIQTLKSELGTLYVLEGKCINDNTVYSISFQSLKLTNAYESNKSVKSKDYFKSMLEIPLEEIKFERTKSGKKIILGRGSYGKVVKGILGNKLNVAIKIINYIEGVKKNEKQFSNEVFLAKSMNHNCVLKVFGWIRISQNKVGIVMEYMESDTLERVIIKSKQIFSNSEKFYLAKKMIESIHYLHKRGTIHRDIKPLNFLLTLKDNMKIIKISDFGFAKLFDSSSFSSTNSTGMIGTPIYLPPEILNNKSHTYASDIYSLGMSLYVLFYEKIPYSNITNPMTLLFQIAKGKKPNFDNKNIPKEFNNIVNMCIYHDPLKRPSAVQLLKHVKNIETTSNLTERDIKMVDGCCIECCVRSKCYVLPCCNGLICLKSLIKQMEIQNSVRISCLGCEKASISRNWLISLKNKKIEECIFKLEQLQKSFCKICSTFIKKETEKEVMMCVSCIRRE